MVPRMQVRAKVWLRMARVTMSLECFGRLAAAGSGRRQFFRVKNISSRCGGAPHFCFLACYFGQHQKS